MCGILVVVNKSDGTLDLAACRRALSLLTWRGPDLYTFETWEGRIFFGQTVLSITGDAAGISNQCLRSASGRYHLGFNGEIYNYRDLAKRWLPGKIDPAASKGTDTEVLVNLHEVNPPHKVPGLLDGMFTYALYDSEAKTVHICRDVQGEKSLYIYEDGERVIISSIISAIHALVPNIPIDVQVLRDSFRTRHFMFLERTAYSGIRQLLPGTMESLDLDKMTWSRRVVQSYKEWIDPDIMKNNRNRSENDFLDELDALMETCIRQMVPEGRKYAAVVSGGVDSSLIAHYLVRLASPDVLVAVNHVGKDRISHELSGFEQVLSRSIHVLSVDQSTYSSEIDRCQRVCGSPLLSHSFVGQSIQSAFVRAKSCRVLFGGDGGDEILGGYPGYLGVHKPGGTYSPSPYMTHEEPRVRFLGDDPSALQNELSAAWVASLQAYSHLNDPGERAIQAMMFCDLAYQLPSVGLRGADLMSMMWSVETRTVLLRQPIIRFALNLPLRAKVIRDPSTPALLRAKPLLKKLFLRYYPQELLVAKQGFAGFPNESALYIGNPEDYMAIGMLGIDPASLEEGLKDRATAWKLVNIEYFLRWNRRIA
jgi:asparagine synthase (glutamine-hydrolysing)